METMRREGFEFQVGRPQVIFKREGGKRLEPIELAVVDVPSDYAGRVIEAFGARGGEMTEMVQSENSVHLEFKIPSRGVMGLRTQILNSTRGEATLFHHFSEYGPYQGEIGGRQNGSLISMSNDTSVAYALDTLQQRGTLFVGPGEKCYEGMVVGEHAKSGDLVVNVAKSKQLTNMRAAGSDKGILLAPPQTFTLEEALEYIEDDELVEVTPKSVRLRKRVLDANERKKAGRRA
jgi:GTP-binding protein